MVHGRFKASWWLPGGHSQTLWPVLTRRVPLQVRSERLELPDGDFVRLDWVGQRGPLVIVLPGLQGDIESAYVRGLLRACESRGWRGVLLNYRGHDEPNRQMRSYHCGMTCDLHHLVHHLAEREPNTPIGGVGNCDLYRYFPESFDAVWLDDDDGTRRRKTPGNPDYGGTCYQPCLARHRPKI